MAESIGIVKQSAAVKDKDSTLPAQEWEGVLLEKVLASLGVSAYTTVKVESADGAGREYTPDVVEANKALLGFKADGKLLDDQSGPVMLAVDGKGPNWQIKKVAKITVIP
jgi:DMSO/TMAO reductase YedYZ molybdopterin-dependent catalytic subunit